MKYRKYCLLSLVILLLGIGNHFTYAKDWKDEDTPISFKIEMLPWEEVDKLLPKYTKFTIIDVETGLQFKVQRRAGSYHADVQPLTKKDTKIMKKIYNGKWSWNRRAIIVLENDQLIAASMHGMPHGAGALQNGFRGHFCIHFYGSITHRKKTEEIAHKLMILKAGGKLEDYINNASPEEILPILGVGLNQNDKKLLNMVNTKTDCSNCLDKLAKDISYFKVSITEEPNEFEKLLKVEIPAQVTYISDKYGKENRNITFCLVREGILDRWKIEQKSLYKNLK